MSGSIYCPGLDLLHFDFTSSDCTDTLNWNPLHCLLCQNPLTEPVVLPCFHVFCRNCVVSRRDQEQQIKCPLCGLEGDASDDVLLSDRIVRYFINTANEKTDLCANCDQVNQPMFFCETCQQPLCNMCKEQTHQAKMFSAHRLVPHDERSGRTTTKLCKYHEEPYILFSTDTKSLGCIMCFRKATSETRSHFTDLDNAHRSGVDKLEKAAKQLKTFQKDVRDGILLHNGLLDEVRKSAQGESGQIQVLCQQMIDRLIEIRDQLLSSINRECVEREEHFRRQLSSLCALVPTIQLNLLIASIFCSSANKLDFLDLAYPLIHRIQDVISEHQNITPSFTAQIQTNYKAEFARALEPFLGMKSVLLPTINGSSLSRQLSSSTCPSDPVFVSTSSANTVPGGLPMQIGGGGNGGDLSPCGSVHSLQYSIGGSSRTKRSSYSHFHRLKLMIDLAGAFGDEYNKIDGQLKQLQKRFTNVSHSAQEVQRDMTMRRCLVDEKRLENVLGQCQRLKIDVGIHSSHVDDLQPTFQHIWEEQLDRVRIQQETYKNHITNVLALREDLHRVITATEQLEPFIRSLTQVIQQIKPERCPSDDPGQIQQVVLMQEIVQRINTLEPNSQLRVDAIERQAQQRKEELERKKQEGSNMLAALKRQLKSAPTKDHGQKRRSCVEQSPNEEQDGHDSGSPIVGSPTAVPTVVVKEVDRERSDSGLLSPGSTRGRPVGGVSPKPHHKRGSNVDSQAKLGGSSASLDESFELLLTAMDCGPLNSKKQSSMADSINSNMADEAKRSEKYGRSQTLSEGVPMHSQVTGQSPSPEPLISHSLPSFSNMESLHKPPEEKKEPRMVVSGSDMVLSEPEVVVPAPKAVVPEPKMVVPEPKAVVPEPKVVVPEPKVIVSEPKVILPEQRTIVPESRVVPSVPRLPPDLIASVAPSTLEARERMLASLKERVPRIDTGPE